MNGFLTFSRVLELTSQNRAPRRFASASPSSENTILEEVRSTLLPTYDYMSALEVS